MFCCPAYANATENTKASRWAKTANRNYDSLLGQGNRLIVAIYGTHTLFSFKRSCTDIWRQYIYSITKMRVDFFSHSNTKSRTSYLCYEKKTDIRECDAYKDAAIWRKNVNVGSWDG